MAESKPLTDEQLAERMAALEQAASWVDHERGHSDGEVPTTDVDALSRAASDLLIALEPALAELRALRRGPRPSRGRLIGYEAVSEGRMVATAPAATAHLVAARWMQAGHEVRPVYEGDGLLAGLCRSAADLDMRDRHAAGRP